MATAPSLLSESLSFIAKLEDRVKVTGAALCVGLDPHTSDLNSNDGAGLVAFCKSIIDATQHVAACYKPNSAFFEAKGPEGIQALSDVIAAIPSGIPILLDVKRGDIGSTSEAYAASAFDHLKVDAVTISPYMGWDSVKPFVSGSFSTKGVFVLCKTSNPSSEDFQSVRTVAGPAIFETVASKAEAWNSGSEACIGLVVGATDADALRRARAAAPSLWILAPGVGAQGGSLEDAFAAGSDASGGKLLVPVSRGISRAADPKAAAEELVEQLKAGATYKAAAAGSSDESSASALLPYQEDFLRNAIDSRVLRFGSFTLKSGRISPYFFNAGLFDSGRAVLRLGRSYAACIRASGIEFDVLFGPAYKGIPLATTIAVALAEAHGIDVPVAYNRKEAKDHGEGGVLVGAGVEGKRVLLVDDVISAGTAVGEAAGLLEASGATLAGVIVGLDRQEVGKDGKTVATAAVRERFGVPVLAVATLADLIQFAESDAEGAEGAGMREHVGAIRAYRAKYGGEVGAAESVAAAAAQGGGGEQ